MIPAKETTTPDRNNVARSNVSGHRSRFLPVDRGMRSAVYPILVALLSTSPLPAKAQDKPLEIGVLALGPRNLPAWQCGQGGPRLAAAEPRKETMPFYALGLLDGLEKLKYVESRSDNAGKLGRRFVLNLGVGTPKEVRGFAREFVRKPVDVIFAVATAAVRIAQEETREHPIPILFPGISDPIGDGFVQSLARPGGFITGVSHQLLQGSGKRVELLKEMLPNLRRLITIRMAGYSVSEKSMVEIRATADRLKIEVLDWAVANRAELQAMLAKVRPETADGIMITPDSFVISNMDLVIETSLEQRVPVFGLQDFMADWGALAAYGPSAFQAGSRVAGYVDKISKGAKPGDLPVEPVDPTFVVNLKAATCLGVTLPLSVLQQADRVIR